MTDQDIHILLGAYLGDYRTRAISNNRKPVVYNGKPVFPAYENIIAWHVARVKLPRDEDGIILPFNAAQILTGTVQYFGYQQDELLEEGANMQRLNNALILTGPTLLPLLLGDINRNGITSDNEATPLFNKLAPDFAAEMENAALAQVKKTVSLALQHANENKFADNKQSALDYIEKLNQSALASFAQNDVASKPDTSKKDLVNTLRNLLS